MRLGESVVVAGNLPGNDALLREFAQKRLLQEIDAILAGEEGRQG